MVDAQISESFYDDADDFALLIGGDVSGEEFQRRVNLAYEAGTGADATVVQELEELYGVQKAQLTEIYLDPTKAKDILQKERQFPLEMRAETLFRAAKLLVPQTLFHLRQ